MPTEVFAQIRIYPHPQLPGSTVMRFEFPTTGGGTFDFFVARGYESDGVTTKYDPVFADKIIPALPAPYQNALPVIHEMIVTPGAPVFPQFPKLLKD